MAGSEKEPDWKWGRGDGIDTANSVARLFETEIQKSINPLRTKRPESELKKSEKISVQIQEFYRHCASKFFKHHYSEGYALDEIREEATRMALDYNEFRTNYANQLKEERVLVSDDNLRADILIDEMEFDELYQYASRMIDYCISSANKTSKDGLEWSVLMNEGAFWDMVCAVIVCAKTFNEQGITRKRFE